MRIAFFVPRCTPENSHGRYVIELAQRLAGDHRVAVYSGAFWSPLRTKIGCHFLPVLNRPTVARLAMFWSASVLAALWQRFDVVHTQGADASVGNVVLASCCNAAMGAVFGRERPIRRRINFTLGALLERYCMTKPSTRRVIAVSCKVKSEIEHHYHVDPQKVVVIPYGVDLECFQPRNRVRWRKAIRERLGLASEDFVILYVGGDYRLKGLIPLVRAVQGLGRKLKVVAVGVLPDQFLTRCLDRDGHKGQIIIVEPTAEIAPYYGAADCFVLPTLYDTFSLATLEAMACGLPVMVSRAAGLSELLTDGVDSLLLESRWNVQELTEKLSWLVADEALRNRLGQNARTTAEQHSWDQVTKRTLSVYQQSLEGKLV